MKLSTPAAWPIGAVAEAGLAAPITLGAAPSLVQAARIAVLANRPRTPNVADFIDFSSPLAPIDADARAALRRILPNPRYTIVALLARAEPQQVVDAWIAQNPPGFEHQTLRHPVALDAGRLGAVRRS